jgi:DNA topoisomerase-1
VHPQAVESRHFRTLAHCPYPLERIHIEGRSLETVGNERSLEKEELRHSADSEIGFTRQRKDEAFCFLDGQGRPIKDAATLERVQALGIPPAWECVWICPDPHGHLQASGRDAKGRKQYIYHSLWTEQSSQEKFERLRAFGKALPAIRKRVEHDLSKRRLVKERVLAAIVRLLETSRVRVGNEQYARQNGSFGLTTLRNRHVNLTRQEVRFRFKGKSGKITEVSLANRQLASIVRKCQELPGQHLFEYLDENGNVRSLGSKDVNDYLKEITGEGFTAKDFRTWIATAEAVRFVRERHPTTARERASIVKEVAALIHNTPAVCRKSYINPIVLDPKFVATIEGLKAHKRPYLSAIESILVSEEFNTITKAG